VARTHVILDDEVLAAIDHRVGQRGRSRFLEQAAREKLDRERLDEALVSTAGMLSAEDYPEWRDREAIADWVRSSRHTEADV
jgi:metal-responsive CopG/Arc/MetJ family transcriptional regulator